ncbi:non-ribosomal peptide synthetase [Streptomyces sp. NPDC002120]|uniref:non-ribosomal peptide synthetase n=1 Tax=Streptomyces sp. NPDC002120 TaxID=3364631 RepID=UPI0036A05B42
MGELKNLLELNNMSLRAEMVDSIDTLVELFNQTVAAYSDRQAVRDDELSLTYGQLNLRSNSLAARLVAHGIRPEDRVGLYLQRSTDVFVAVLGILKAGAAYVAIDPRYPDARRDLMLRDSGATTVLTAPEWQDRLADLDIKVIAFRSRDDDQVPTLPMADVKVLPDNAASVLFTSGSSGTPKAIVLEHRNLVSFARNPSLPALREDDRTGQISSLSFDAFHFEMWRTFAHGAEVAVLPPVPDLLAADFQREMRRRGITAMLVPTMVVNHVVREDRDAFASLRVLQFGGDVILPSACRDLLAGAFAGELYNLYGPAEITTACTAHRVTAQDAEGDAIPIGRALHGVTTHVLDSELHPVAPGETGELYVGGDGVARGYLDAALTEECFIPDPSGSGDRLYRTGDLVRAGEDGALDFIGRADGQIKIRGYRVETGEVERGLRRHPEVHEAVVLANGEGDDRHLIAFVVLDGTLAPKELRAFAEAELPDFMVPSLLVVLEDIPASDHGKRDLDALRELAHRHQERRQRHVAPATETEHLLVTLWEELLTAESIGTGDDFFELGGNSLLAFRLQNRIKRDLGVALEHRVVLRNPVLAALAAAIDAARDESPLI